MSATKYRVLGLGFGAALLGGCAAGPDFIPPEAPAVAGLLFFDPVTGMEGV